MRIRADLLRLQDTTAQIRVRAALVLFVGFAAVADALGLEVILGAFIAGAIVSLADRDQAMTHPDFRRKLEAIGFGFFIPVFFVSSGVRFDLDALTSSTSSVVMVPVFLAALVVVRGLPAALYRHRLGPRKAAIAGLMQATSLPFIVAATAIGHELGLIDAAGQRRADRRRPAVGPVLPARRADPAAPRRRRARARRRARPDARDVTPRRSRGQPPIPTEEPRCHRPSPPPRRAATRMPGLKGKNVLVTGGSSGIGQAIAVRFAEYGANVAINYLRQPEEARETEEQVHACVHKVRQEGVQDVLVGGDVSNEDDVVRMVGEAADALGGIDVLVNNAGIQISRPSAELSSADFDRVIAVNLRGSFLCAREAIRHFLAEDAGGSIVNVSSVHQLIPKPNYLGYSASKGGMQNLTRTLALEYAAQGIRVNGIGPGATVTPINRAWIDDPVKRAQVEEHIPMRRAGDADEMAGVTAFLASDLAAYITGQTIFVDGGLTLFPSFATPWSSE